MEKLRRRTGAEVRRGYSFKLDESGKDSSRKVTLEQTLANEQMSVPG
jgi:hypothetical protein